MSMTIQSSVKDKILATSSETSKVENTPAEMLRDLDQQMEKREMMTTDKVVLIKDKFKAARDRQKSYADNSRKPLEFEVGNHELLKISCLADASLHVPLDEIKVDKTLCFVEEPVKNSDREAFLSSCGCRMNFPVLLKNFLKSLTAMTYSSSSLSEDEASSSLDTFLAFKASDFTCGMLLLKEDSLWVRWINVIKLKGRSVWEIDKQLNDSRMWKSLLDLKDATRKHMQYKIGNGKKISMWHDRWSLMPAIDSILSRKDIYTAGFSNDDTVAECVQNNLPEINVDSMDKMLWCSNSGTTTEFSSNQVWKDMRILNDEMKWWKVIWFSQNVPRQAFVLWMASKGKLVTQDKLSEWYHSNDWKCPMCLQVEDSHKHLFFECEYFKTVWEKVQQMENVNNLKDLDECMIKFSKLPCKNSIWSIVRRWCLVDPVYHLWIERNARLFHQEEKSNNNMLKHILGSVSNRLMTLRVKNSNAVKEVEDKWGIMMMKMQTTRDLQRALYIDNKNLSSYFNPTGFNGRAVSLSSVLCKLEVKGLTYCHKIAKWDCFPEQLLSKSDARNGNVALGDGSQ
ncbi:RNA-directed DNA polymerase, eukaryota, reverse transcriptase zinc-binding domain protein [Tanacetum coccineum]|uniref:RNA-directed DNA polymerase, eukaryota, reverse transcriptase zinc-binding domain protein n=1 Tax=Tanacetum coccineum TaxID=301880 RepID=A0ABQ5J3C7_9ASTR